MEADLIKHFFPIELLDHFEYRSSQIKMGEHGEYISTEMPGSASIEMGGLQWTEMLGVAPLNRNGPH